MTLRRKFLHEPILDQHHGKIKAYCRCGYQTRRRFETVKEALKAHAAHVGLKELQSKDLFT